MFIYRFAIVVVFFSATLMITKWVITVCIPVNENNKAIIRHTIMSIVVTFETTKSQWL